ncbi:MAG: hypothetical protein C0483_14685 [Pirellula sp.]|nr:hypothetical protein [Pirellula sp.]
MNFPKARGRTGEAHNLPSGEGAAHPAAGNCVSPGGRLSLAVHYRPGVFDMHRRTFQIAFASALLLACVFAALTDQGAAQVPAQAAKNATSPAAAWPPQIKRVLPPVAKPLAPKDQEMLELELAKVQQQRDRLHASKPDAANNADVDILLKAVRYALLHGEFFDHKKDLARAETLLDLAEDRLELMTEEGDILAEKRGPMARGFYSAIDGSAQPYGLIVPEKLDLSKPAPLYVWLHGRGDTSCDLQFISGFLGTKSPGPLQPANAIVLHPFGRYCNGYKSAGEVDVLEAIEDVKKHYKIDADRVVLAGFSMGGAGAWHMGAHYADHWCAVHAGAGFVDVKRYQNITDDKLPPWYVQKLWGLYDVPDYKRNFLNVPLLAYSGEQDKQKAAADIMEAELAQEGLKLTHLIGPGMGHKYHPEVLLDVQKRLAAMVEMGRNNDRTQIAFQTRTLRYSKLGWVEALALDKHWEDARIDAAAGDKTGTTIATKNVAALRLTGRHSGTELTVDGQSLTASVARSGDAAPVILVKKEGRWSTQADLPWQVGKRKTPGLQGPIDDAFVSRFTMIMPDQEESAVDRWALIESRHFWSRWDLLMRGEPRAKTVSNLSEGDGARLSETDNLVLFGTPQSNPLIAHVLDKLPIKWTGKTVGMGDLEFDATKVVPVLIYPNPLNPAKYVVLNSGLTFREAHDKTNSQQNPKLPDWAFVDVTQPPTDEYPGKVLAAGFFDEEWKYVKQPAVDAK